MHRMNNDARRKSLFGVGSMTETKTPEFSGGKSIPKVFCLRRESDDCAAGV